MFMISHRIAGITFCVESPVEIPGFMNERFQKFVNRVAESDVSIRYHFIETKAWKKLMKNIIKKNNTLVQILNIVKNSEIEVTNSLKLQERLANSIRSNDRVCFEITGSALAIFDFKQCYAELFFPSDQEYRMTDRRVGFSVYALFLPAFSSMIVHGAGLIRKDRAVVFLAPDGGGKTTVVQSADSGTILSDDQIILRKDKKNITVHGTPWGLYSSSTRNAPLGGFFLLNKSERFAISRVAPESVFAYLWEEHGSYRMKLPKTLQVGAFSLVNDFSRFVPAFRMDFPQNHIDWPAIDNTLEL